MKEKMKKFWTLTKRQNAGFTLVELIVVIAILAILAGVAVPAYSAYVKKANIQADKTLVDEVVSAFELAHYTKPLDGVVTVVLQKDGIEIVGDTEEAKAWAAAALSSTYGEGYASALKLQYDGWGNGVAVTNVMLTALQNGNFSDAMEAIYGSADSLSFTEEIPTLVEEIKSVAVEVGGSDSAAIGIVSTAASATSNWDVDAIKSLWKISVEYSNKKYVGVDTYISGLAANEAKLTIAALLRAKNTCLALYASQNGYSQYYDKLASFSYSDDSIVPYDLTRAGVQGSDEFYRLCEVLDLDPSTEADAATLNGLGTLLTQYYTATDSKGNPVSENDAVAYAAMMGIVDGLATDENSPLSSNDLDEYFNAISGPVSLFQQLVTGAVDITTLTNSLGTLSTTGSNVSITLIPDGYDLVTVVGPTSAQS